MVFFVFFKKEQLWEGVDTASSLYQFILFFSLTSDSCAFCPRSAILLCPFFVLSRQQGIQKSAAWCLESTKWALKGSYVKNPLSRLWLKIWHGKHVFHCVTGCWDYQGFAETLTTELCREVWDAAKPRIYSGWQDGTWKALEELRTEELYGQSYSSALGRWSTRSYGFGEPTNRTCQIRIRHLVISLKSHLKSLKFSQRKCPIQRTFQRFSLKSPLKVA